MDAHGKIAPSRYCDQWRAKPTVMNILKHVTQIAALVPESLQRLVKEQLHATMSFYQTAQPRTGDLAYE